jgi:DNA-binding NarL/FixJ family response regulator
LEENWCALYISILKNVTPEQAFIYLYPKVERNKNIPKRFICNDNTLREMTALYDSGLSNKEIAQRYGIGTEAIRAKIYRYKKKMNMLN